MPTALPPLPAKHTVLHTFTAHVSAGPAVVFLTLQRHLDPASGQGAGLFADEQTRTIVALGAWWYRGEYRVSGDDRGSSVEHVVYNVAQRGERAARLAGRRVIQQAPLEFHELVTSLRAELGRTSG